MGKQIHLDKVRALFNKSPVVNFGSLSKIIGNSAYTKILLHNLIKRGEIDKLSKGIYTKHKESSLVVFAFEPAYLGLQCALSHWGVSEQETIPIIITMKKVRIGIRKVMNSNILIKKINKEKFFGFELFKEGKFYLPYSDIEKTLIDMVVFNQKIDLETLQKIKRIINKKRMDKYLKHYDKRIRKKVIEMLN